MKVRTITLMMGDNQYLNDTAVGNIRQWSKDWSSYLLGWYLNGEDK